MYNYPNFRVFFVIYVLVLVSGPMAWSQEVAVTAEDTVEISAPRVTIAEVIAAVGQKMESDWARIENHEFTGLYTSIARNTPGLNGGNYTLYESASRYRLTRGHAMQQVRLWQRKRRYENNQLVSDEADDKVKQIWSETGKALIEAIPFTPESGNRYNYEVLDCKLIGNSLVYKIRFSPRSQFETLPSGTVWVDYSNWVIRKLDASMTGAAPMPFLVKDVPFYRMTKVQVGDFWVNGETHTLARMRSVPLVPVPNNLDVKFSAVDHVINGSPLVVEDAIDTSEFWMSEEEAEKETAAYWEDLDREFSRGSSVQFLCDEPMACGNLDSLAAAGSDAFGKIARGDVWETSFHAVQEPGFNRVQGPVWQVGIDVEQPGPRGAKYAVGLGYGFASQRPTWRGVAELPLISGSWDDSMYRGIQYTALSLEFQAAQGAIPFAGDQRLTTYERSLSAFLYGSDPNHYYEERSLAGDLTWRAMRRVNIVLEGSYSRQKPMAEKADWNLLGNTLSPTGNRQIQDQNVAYWGLGFQWAKGPLSLDGKWGNHQITESEYYGDYGQGLGSENLKSVVVSGSWNYLDPAGNRWILKGTHFALDEMAPIQMQTWYGDWGSLRGHPAGSLNGEVGQNAAFDLHLGFDFWRALRIPVLGRLSLQPHVFVDYAATRAKGDVGTIIGNQGTRWDVGFGFGKLVGSVGAAGPAYLRVHAAVPVGSGSTGLPWRVLVGLGN